MGVIAGKLLRRQNRNFGKTGKVAGIECVDPLAVDVHGGEDLQIEDVAARDGTPRSRRMSSSTACDGTGNTWRKSSREEIAASAAAGEEGF